MSVPFCAQIFTTCTRLNVLSCSSGSVMKRLLHGSAAQTTNNKTGSPLTGHLSVLLSFFFFPLVPTIMVMIIPAHKGCVCVDDNNNENTTFCHFFFMKQITCRLKNVFMNSLNLLHHWLLSIDTCPLQAFLEHGAASSPLLPWGNNGRIRYEWVSVGV